MAVYESKVKVGGNRVRAVEIQARNKDEAMKHMARMGRVVTFKKKSSIDWGIKMSAGERQIFFTRLSSMLSSRVGTSEALALLRDTFTGKIQEVSGRLLNYVQGGCDLAEAFERVGPPDFPSATIALIKAGARSGETGRAIKDAAVFEYELHNISKGATKGLITGVLAFIGAGVMTLGSTLYLGPKIMESDLIQAGNKNGDVDIGWITLAGNITGYIMCVMLFVGICFWLLSSVGRRIAPIGVDRLIMKIPYYKDLILSKNNFVVLYGLALLIKSGVRTEDALKLSAEGAPKGALKADLLSALNAVKTGRPWAKAMSTLHPTDKAALLCATDREQIAATLNTLAAQYRELYGQRIASFVPLVNLLASLFLSISGGIIFGQSILPMLMASGGLL